MKLKEITYFLYLNCGEGRKIAVANGITSDSSIPAVYVSSSNPNGYDEAREVDDWNYLMDKPYNGADVIDKVSLCHGRLRDNARCTLCPIVDNAILRSQD